MRAKKPHILFLASWYPVAEKSTHGIFIQRHAMALALYAEVSVAYVYPSDNPDLKPTVTRLSDKCTEYRMAYHRSRSILKPFLHYWRARKAYRLLFRMIQSTNSIPVSVIQVNVIFPVALWLPLARSVFRTPYTIVEHWSGYLPEDGNYRGILKKWITQRTVRQAKKIYYVSEPQRLAMLGNGLQGNYELLFNVVDTQLFKPGQKQSKPLLIHISSLVEREKNIAGTFNVLRELQEKEYAFETIIIGGEGDELKQARQKATEYGLKDIAFMGNLPPEILVQHLQRAHALVLFSHFEGMPVVALEAMACGVPVLATKVGHLPFIINENTGILTERYSTRQQVEAIELILKNKVHYEAQYLHDWVRQHASYEAIGMRLDTYYNTRVK